MDLKERIKAFAELGRNLRGSLSLKDENELDLLIRKQQLNNAWFTPENVRYALGAIAAELTEENLESWTDRYPGLGRNSTPVRTGLVFAGNIPLAGFHDFLTVLISGNSFIAKTSSKDPDLIPYLGRLLSSVHPGFSKRMEFTDGQIRDFEVVIATGSNNSSRYFEYYFGKYPNIIRKNRNSVAVITSEDTEDQLYNLGIDVFTYFGLGCRSVSKIFVPRFFDLSQLWDLWKPFSGCINHAKYANNYDYNKALMLVNREKFADTGYMLMKEHNSSLASPVSVLHYEYYDDIRQVKEKIGLLKESIQCVIGKDFIPFGQSQLPHLWDYADEKDTLDFLLKKNLARIL